MGAPSNTPPAAPDAAGAREVTAFPYRRDWPSCPDLHRYFHTYTCVHSCAGTQTALPPRQRFAIVNDQVTRAYIPSGEAVGGPDQDTETKKSNGPRTTRNSTRVYPACQWRQEIRWSPSPTPGRAEPPAGPTSHRRSHHGRIFVFSPSVPREAGDIRMPSRKRGISRPPNPRNSEPPELRNSGTGAPGAGRSSSRRATSARTVRRGLPAQSGTRHIPGVDKSSEEPSHAWFSTDRRHRISASMKSSSSPSRTPLVFEVSVSVRRSFTIWYGWRT
ncbi:hypothetical protein CcI6DRAFT_00416 [Frankia sp. CcI6]|nr:hypothetical protein CcI6DRAFT_00416 [Frankia sp. CcI6]KFB05584.1 hypothetical protein ALLO2DRAFT_01536 [Frankia sp. Allo2]